MRALCTEIIRRCSAGEMLALCVVVNARGSTPQKQGAKMLVLAGGTTIGTLGGGCVEAEVRKRALELLSRGESKLLSFRLDHDYGWDDGLVCGGVMDIAVQLLRQPSDAEPFDKLAGSIDAGQSDIFELTYRADETASWSTYREPIEPPPRLIIAGAGHVGHALAALAQSLRFELTVIDDRADMVSADRFPHATQRIIGDIEIELSRLALTDRSYVVIVTRGHRHDGQALGAVVRSAARYIGLIGSRRKIKRILEDLSEQGVPREMLERVHAPIGLEIGAVTVPEIAISIAAELIAVRHGLQNHSASPLKISADELAIWLDREALRSSHDP